MVELHHTRHSLYITTHTFIFSYSSGALALLLSQCCRLLWFFGLFVCFSCVCFVFDRLFVFVSVVAFTLTPYFIYYALCLSRRLLVFFVSLAVRLYLSFGISLLSSVGLLLCLCFFVLLWGWFAVVFPCGLHSMFLFAHGRNVPMAAESHVNSHC